MPNNITKTAMSAGMWTGLGGEKRVKVKRPPLQRFERRVSVGFSVSVAQHKALTLLGGNNRSLWLRDAIDREMERLGIDADKLEAQ